MSATAFLLLGGAAVAIFASRPSSPSSLSAKGTMTTEVPVGVAPPKFRGAPFAPIPSHARFWPVKGRPKTVNYVAEGKGFQGYAAGNVFGAPRGAGTVCPNGRKHCGIDMRAQYDDICVAVGNGKIVGAQGWSGPNAKAIVIALDDGPVVVYGAIKPGSMAEFGVQVGSVVKAGQPVCRIGRYPGGSTMLHLETYKAGTSRNAKWCAGQNPPSNLLDPSAFLLNLAHRDSGAST